MTFILQDKQHLPGPLCKCQYALAYDSAYEEVFADRIDSLPRSIRNTIQSLLIPK